ncbi:TPA: hypothetical protein ACN7DV_000772, partial [Klebsiella pneumoniae]
MLKTEDLNTMISIDEIHFADWQIWPQLRILLHRGKPVRISARAFDVLVVKWFTEFGHLNRGD